MTAKTLSKTLTLSLYTSLGMWAFMQPHGGCMVHENKLLEKLGVQTTSMLALESHMAFWTVHATSMQAHSGHMVFWMGHGILFTATVLFQ